MKKNSKVTISLPEETITALDEYAASTGLKNANTLLAAAGLEIEKAYKLKMNVWHVLGNIAANDDEPQPLPGAARPKSRALEISR